MESTGARKKVNKTNRFHKMFVPFFPQHVFVQMSKLGVNNCRHSHSLQFVETMLRNSVFLEIVAPALSTDRLAHTYAIGMVYRVFSHSFARTTKLKEKKNWCESEYERWLFLLFIWPNNRKDSVKLHLIWNVFLLLNVDKFGSCSCLMLRWHQISNRRTERWTYMVWLAGNNNGK